MVELTQATLDQITRRLVDELSPERIYLFGSRAYGTPRSSSDVDLVVIVPDGDVDRFALNARAYSAVGRIGCGIDVLVYPATRFDRRSGWRANFEHTVRNNGKLLYGVDGMAFAREWLEKAWRDRTAARRLLEGEPALVDMAAFHCQQTIEKTLKAFLVHHNVVFEKLHELALLCDLCQRIDPEFASLRVRVGPLSAFAVHARYPDEPAPTLEEVEAGLKVADDVWEFVVNRLPEELRNVKRP
jgi:HEPN domain-containing protein/predicted nucleotidyltransferase